MKFLFDLLGMKKETQVVVTTMDVKAKKSTKKKATAKTVKAKAKKSTKKR